MSLHLYQNGRFRETFMFLDSVLELKPIVLKGLDATCNILKKKSVKS